MSGPDASVVLRCDCSDLGHLIVFDAWHWDTDRPVHSELYAHLELETHLPWWRRLAMGARYALTGKTTKWWWTDNVLNDESAKELRDFLSRYLAQSLNAASAGTHPKDGDVKQAPLVSGAMPEGQAPNPNPISRTPKGGEA